MPVEANRGVPRPGGVSLTLVAQAPGRRDARIDNLFMLWIRIIFWGTFPRRFENIPAKSSSYCINPKIRDW